MELKVAEIMGHLAQHLTTDERGRHVWRGGWSAQRVAKLTGVSRAFVSEVRHWRLAPVTVQINDRGLKPEATPAAE